MRLALVLAFGCHHVVDTDTDTAVGDTDTGPPPDVAHPLCDGDIVSLFPVDMGDACAMGSNQPLCVDASSDQCSSGLCLWNADDPTGTRAYCTTDCSLGDAASCPATFECQRDLCDDRPVCVRTEVPSSDTAAKVEAERFFGEGYQGYWIALGSDGTATWVNSNGAVRQIGPRGLEDPGDIVPLNRALGVESDGVVWVWPRGGAVDILVRIAEGAVETHDLDIGVGSRGGFRADDGTLYYAADDACDHTVYFQAFDPATLANVGDPVFVTDGPLVPTEVVPLRDHGFVALCLKGEATVLCAGDGPNDILELPALEGLDTPTFQMVLAMRRSLSLDALWFTDEDIGLFRWNGTKWIAEDELEPYRRPSVVVPMADRRAMIKQKQ
jgi:hypothetical protein